MKKNLLKKDRSEMVFGWAMLAPALLFMICFIVYPLFYNIVTSLQNVTAVNLVRGTRSFVGLDNYIAIFTGRYLGNSIQATLVYTIGCIIVQFSLGFLLAIVYTQKAKKLKKISGLLLVAYIMPVTVTAIVFKFYFQTTGVVNILLKNIGLVSKNIEWLSSPKAAMFAVIFTNIWTGIAFNMVLLQSGLINIPADVYESASIDGASGPRQFWSITLPLMKRSILMVLVLGFVYTFKTFELIYIMTAGGPSNATELLSIYSYKRSFIEYNFGEGSAIVMVFFVILLVVGLVYVKLLKNEEE